MSHNVPLHSGVSYRVILCRYNEIGLKALPYQAKIFQFFMSSIKTICAREQLHLQSALELQGRLIFFFPPEEIPNALQVFRRIIGFQSISPAISVPRKFHLLERGFLALAQAVVKPEDILHITFKTVVPYPKSEKDLITALFESLAQSQPHKIQIARHKKEATRHFTIEMREKGTYIYCQTFPTIWGGFPIESKNAFLCPITSNQQNWKLEQLAAQFLVRRGSIVCPVILGTDPFDSDLEHPVLRELAQYYSSSLPVFYLNLSPLLAYLHNHVPSSEDRGWYFFVGVFILLDRFIQISRDRTPYRYGDRKLHFKGVVNAFDLRDTAPMQVLENFPFLSLSPLTSLHPSSVTFIIDQIPDLSLHMSFQALVASTLPTHDVSTPHPTVPDSIPDISTLSYFSRFLGSFFSLEIVQSFTAHSPPFREISEFFARPTSHQILTEIEQTLQIIPVAGKIL
ncbi:MAG: hypothetical protein ACTSWW_06675 [Promethearchaeota archaeon]